MNKELALEKILNWFESQAVDTTKTEFELKSKYIFTFRNKYQIHLKCISWKDLLNINAKAFSKNTEGAYFNTEKQKRLILSKALEKIVDLESHEVHYENLLDNLNQETVELIWEEYQTVLHLSAEEVNLIYSSAKNYFNNSKEYFPVLPEILEIDYILKGIVSLSRSEFNSLSNKEFEIMQLVLSAKNELDKKL